MPDAKTKEYSLSNSQLEELAKLACKVEDHYQFAQDIEWAYAKEKLYLLQARPITTLNNKNNQKDLLDITNISKFQKTMLDDLIEHYPEAATPLDYAVVTMSYQALLDCARRGGIKVSSAEEIINFSADGKITLCVPQIKMSLKTLRMPLLLFKSTRVGADYWEENKLPINTLIRHIETKDINSATNHDLIEVYNEVFRLAQKINDVRFFYIGEASILAIIGLSLVLKVFAEKNKRPDLTELVTTGLDYMTARIDREIKGLAIKINDESEVKQVLMTEKFSDLESFKNRIIKIAGGKVVISSLESFLKTYGYRTGKMYQPFTSKSWSEDFAAFLVVLRATIQDPKIYQREELELSRRHELEKWIKKFNSRLWFPFNNLFMWSYNRLRMLHVIREDTLFHLEMLFTAGRKLVDEIAKRITNLGYLNGPEDIIYLRKEEISEVLLGRINTDTCQLMITQRKSTYPINQQLWKQNLLRLGDNKHKGDTLSGLAGSPGLAKGPVRIITDINEFSKLQKDDILVCPYTDPSWTPLFGIAAAVVADTGGPASHAAIVAREYGIPAILGTKIGTSCLQDGETVVVDGTTGSLYRHNL